MLGQGFVVAMVSTLRESSSNGNDGFSQASKENVCLFFKSRSGCDVDVAVTVTVAKSPIKNKTVIINAWRRLSITIVMARLDYFWGKTKWSWWEYECKA
jgi:hypothetical protein